MAETQLGMDSWLHAARHVARRVGERFMQAHGPVGWASMVARWIISVGGPLGAWGIQPLIPGVRNLYPWAFPLIVLAVALLILVFLEAVTQRRHVVRLSSPSQREQARADILGAREVFRFLQRQVMGPLSEAERNHWADVITKQVTWASDFLGRQPIDRDLQILYLSDVHPPLLVQDGKKAGCDLGNAPLWILTENRIRRLEEIYQRLVD